MDFLKEVDNIKMQTALLDAMLDWAILYSIPSLFAHWVALKREVWKSIEYPILSSRLGTDQVWTEA